MLSWVHVGVAAVAAVPGFIALLPRRKLKKEVEAIKRDAERLSRNQRILTDVVLRDYTADSRRLLELAVDHTTYIEGNH